MKFVELYCAPPKGSGAGRPLKLDRWQIEEIVEPALADGIGQAYFSIPKSNGKSTLFAALALSQTFLPSDVGAPVVPVVATTTRQADLTTYKTAVSMVRACSELDDRSIVYAAAGGKHILVPANEGEMILIPADRITLAGLDTTFGIADEVGFLDVEQLEALAQGCKRAGSRVIGIGTPSPDRSTSALWAIRTMVREGRAPAGLYYQEWAADEGADVHDEAQYHKANPGLASGIVSLEKLRLAADTMPEGRFRIYRLGIWATGHDSWLGGRAREIWDHLVDRDYELDTLSPVYVGVDIGRSSDCSAVVAIQQDAEEIWHIGSKIWTPTAGQENDVRDVERFLLKLDAAFDVAAIGFDERLFERSAVILAEEGLMMERVPQSASRMAPATAATRDLIMQGRIHHNGERQLADHVVGATAKDMGENGYMLSKRRSPDKIDAAIALVMAVSLTLRADA